MDKKILIVASGPSAVDTDLKKATQNGYSTFAVNGSIHLFEQQNTQPDYYMVDDLSFAKKRLSLILLSLKKTKTRCFFPPKIIDYLKEKAPLELKSSNYEMVYHFNKKPNTQRKKRLSIIFRALFSKKTTLFSYNIFSGKSVKIGFSTSKEAGYFGGRTIAYNASQIAHWLGYKEFVFTGLDLSYQGDTVRFYVDTDNKLPSTLSEDFQDHIEPSFITFARLAKKQHLKLVNLSPNSRLSNNIIRKTSFNEFMSEQ